MFRISAKSIRQHGTALALIMMVSASWGVSAKATDHVYDFKIPAEDTAKALNDFARQADIQIMFPYAIAAKHQAPAITGQYTRAEVLNRLLDGTGLEVANVTETTISLRAVTAGAKAPTSSLGNDTTEVVVTGTHIRGGNPTSPIHILTRKDIDASGYSQIGDLMRSLPENFGGGQNPGLTGASGGNIANQNITNASTVSLRGLGTDATLILVNGHRLNADSYYQGSDISGVPLGAVDRIEIVPDGASALYGSDAVAGVVNIILRKNQTGGEFSAQTAVPSRKGGAQQTVSLLQGISGNRGHLLANFEYSRQEPLLAGERALTSGMDPTYTLLRFQERRSLFLNAGYDLTDRISLSLDALLYDRRAIQGYTTSGALYQNPTYTPAYSVAPQVNFKLPNSWNLSALLDASGSRNAYYIRNKKTGAVSHSQYENWSQYSVVSDDGPIFTLPSGVVKGAFGGGYRTEGFQQGLSFSASKLRKDRNVTYLYGEALVPLVTPSDQRTGLHELELSLSARAERYNDIGSNTSPKVGLRYVPAEGLTLRATWGKSFKAPSLLQMYSDPSVVLFNAVAFGSSTAGSALWVSGGNPNLKPERSTSWTAGADYKFRGRNPATIGFNYFSIDYTDRVVQPIGNLTQAFSNPLYAPFVQLSPSTADQAAAIAAAADFTNAYASTYDPSQVRAILWNQYQNATSQTVRGLDASYRQRFSFSAGDLSAFANATWIRLNQQTISTSPNAKLSGTLYNVPNFKARGGATWISGGISLTGIVNYVSGQRDTGVTPYADLASGTTVDATVSYQLPETVGFRRGVKFVLSASNLFDKDPPRTLSPVSQTVAHFDSTNSSVIGRVVSLTVSKAW